MKDEDSILSLKLCIWYQYKLLLFDVLYALNCSGFLKIRNQWYVMQCVSCDTNTEFSYIAFLKDVLRKETDTNNDQKLAKS